MNKTISITRTSKTNCINGKTITRTSQTNSINEQNYNQDKSNSIHTCITARSLGTFKRSKLKKTGTHQLVISPWVEDSLGLQERACTASAVHGAIWRVQRRKQSEIPSLPRMHACILYTCALKFESELTGPADLNQSVSLTISNVSLVHTEWNASCAIHIQQFQDLTTHCQIMGVVRTWFPAEDS